MVLPAVLVYGLGAKVVSEGGALVYRKWVEAPRGLRPGELVVVESSRGELLGCGLYDNVGPVAVRMVWFGSCPFKSPREAIEHLIERALRYRERLGYTKEDEPAYRLVHSDADLMPGLIIDVYNDIAVIQSSSIVWDVHMDIIVDVVSKVVGVEHVYEKSTQRTRRDIGLEPRERLLRGSKTRTIIREGGVRFVVDVRKGQKTGFFLDQRLNRIEVERYSSGEVVLDLFSYTGGFGIHALVAGARKVVFVDEDEHALAVLRENLRLNGINEDKAVIVQDNVWRYLRREKSQYGIVIADPPAFIQAREHYERGKQAYERLFSNVAKLASSIAFMSSCSAFLTRNDFLEIVARSVLRAGKQYRLVGSVRGMPPDHPQRYHAEHLEYLKAVYVEVF
ncbi:conserved hypothetical protein CHP00095 [Pyrolobus fumarii 1A]|uniref:Class I SAM-dependent rRNA methyltransferase n=1 Tax=Pyrolobus fumarii (strain DSM 11204 / 1A) TaxID=694429 RepID=G0EEF5_PYRF1|nr:class I SAM-dependent rRNA methyltransferase [Pyrolobus fumarii]AEM37996.1 conserved hypothetical protein CHP00095 [Pyrolobus fumarii 1A]